MKDVEGTVEFLSLLGPVASRLGDHGRSIFEVQYNGLSFGSWSLTAGTRKHRVHLQWDGKEQLLSISTAHFGDSQSRPKWNALSPRPLSAGSSQERFALVEALILEHSGAAA